MNVQGVYNLDGGTFRTMDVQAFAARSRAVFAEHGHDLDIDIVAGADVVAALKRAAEGAADALLVGGGDGTVSAAAAAAWREGKALAALPAGTMNLFARALALPLDLDLALAALADGNVEAVDIATANGQPFIHQFSVGYHPRVVRLRNGYSYSSRLGKIAASARAMWEVGSRPRRFPVQCAVDGESSPQKLAALSVSNNPMQPGVPPIAASLNEGKLALYRSDDVRMATLLRLLADMIMGRSFAQSWVDVQLGREIVVTFPKLKAKALAVVDGELQALEREIRFEIHPGALKVLAPRAAAEVPSRPDAATKTAA